MYTKKAAHSTKLCAAYMTANLLMFFTFRPFAMGGGKIEHYIIFAFIHLRIWLILYQFQTFFSVFREAVIVRNERHFHRDI